MRIIEDSSLYNGICLSLFFITILSEILYFNFGGANISIIFLLSPIALVYIFYKNYYFLNNRFFILIYLYMCVVLVYTILGLLFFLNISILYQIYIYIILPIIFLAMIKVDKILLMYFLFFLMLLTTLFSFSQFFYFSLGLNGPASVFSIITTYIQNNQLNFINSELIYGRSTGIFINPNELGFFSGLVFWLAFSIRENSKFLNFLIVVLLCIINIGLSFSRTAIVALMVSLLFIFILKFYNNKIKISYLYFVPFVFVFVFLFLSLFAGFVTESQLSRLLEINIFQSDLNQSNNLIQRFEAWSHIVEFISINPLGTIIPPGLVIEHTADNQFIYAYAQGGIVLLIFVILLYFNFIKISFISNRSYSYIGAFIFLLFYSFTMPVLNSFICSIFWLILANSLYDIKFRGSN